MTMIRLDAAAVTQLQAAEGRVVLCDEHGSPIRLCTLSPLPAGEPQLTDEEWQRRAKAPGGKTTAEVLNYLQGLGRS